MPLFDDLQNWVPTRESIPFWDSPYGAELEHLETLETARGSETGGEKRKTVEELAMNYRICLRQVSIYRRHSHKR